MGQKHPVREHSLHLGHLPELVCELEELRMLPLFQQTAREEKEVDEDVVCRGNFPFQLAVVVAEDRQSKSYPKPPNSIS